MPHREYIRLVPGADTAVLFLHGIAGTPRHFDARLPLVHLVPENWSVYTVLLPGHGGSVEDFSAATMQHWKQYVWGTFDSLAETHQRVILVGHSMGTLFALQLAMEKQERIPFLLLIAAPLCPRLSLSSVIHSWSLIFAGNRGLSEKENAMYQCGSVTLTRKLWKYIPWSRNFLSLLVEANRTKRAMPHLQTKCVAIQSRHDELVARRSAKFLKNCTCVQCYELQKSTHFSYAPDETQFVQNTFLELIREVEG